MPQIGPMELLIVLGIVVVIFGAGKLGDLGGALGKGIREFREQTKLDDEKAKDSAAAAAATTAAPAPAAPGPVAQVPLTASVVACPSCGRQNAATQTFCGSCGTRLAAPAGTAGA